MKRRHESSQIPHPSCSVMVSANSSDYSNLPFPNFAKPEEVAVLAVDANKNAAVDGAKDKFFVPPKSFLELHYDLNVGFSPEKVEEGGDIDKCGIKALLQWILHKRVTGKGLKETVLGADFISWRGLLTRLASTPYESRDGWKIGIVRFGDVYFLREYETEEKYNQRISMTEKEKRMTYWGRKFEQYVICDDPKAKPNPNRELETTDYSSIVRSKLVNHRLLFAGEIDCRDPHTGLYLEMKTNRIFSNHNQERNFHRYKTLKWWIQSFLVRIESIVCGFRDDNGIVHELKIFQLRDLAKDPRAEWSAAVCMNFLNKVFDLIKLNIKESDPRRVFLMEWSPGQKHVRIRESINQNEQFLPHWFVEKFVS